MINLTILLSVAVILLIAIVFIFLLWVDYALGRKKHLKTVSRMNPSPAFANFVLFADGPSLFDDYFTELKKAKHHIHILFYIVKDEGIGQEFLTILKQKANEGVEVRLLLDWAGSLPIILNFKLKKELRSHGIQLAFAHTPTFPFLFYNVQARNHRKISVIDGKVGYLGGFNVGPEYINLDRKLTPWRDYHLKVNGEGAHTLQSVFLQDWADASNQLISKTEKYFPKDITKGSVEHQFKVNDGAFLKEEYIALIENAEQFIEIGTPYFIPDVEVMQHLLSALTRGVKVTIMIPYTSDHFLVKEASHRYLRPLLKAGAEVYEYKKGFYHAKAMIVDEVAVVGTANFDKRSFFLNDEINCYSEDLHFHKELSEVFHKDLANAEKLQYQDISGFNLKRQGKELLARCVDLFL